MEQVYDTLIIGGGPTGLSAVFYARMRGLSTILVEAQSVLGGQVSILYPEKPIYDVAGFPEILGKTLIANLYEQVEQLEATIKCHTQIINFEKKNGYYHATTTDHDIIKTKTVLIAGGIGAFTPKKLNVTGEDQFENKGVIYTVTNFNQLKNKTVLIVGAGDSAFDWAINLVGKAKHITLIHRSDRFRAQSNLNEELMRLQANGLVTIKTFYELKEIHGDDEVTGATIFDNRTKDEEYLAADCLLINVGFLSNLDFLQDWGIELSDNKKGIKVASNMETNLPGVFACGDITSYHGKVKLITTGFGEASIAANAAFIHIHPDGRLTPAHNVKPADVMAKNKA